MCKFHMLRSELQIVVETSDHLVVVVGNPALLPTDLKMHPQMVCQGYDLWGLIALCSYPFSTRRIP